jgi:CHAT domain-containing protein
METALQARGIDNLVFIMDAGLRSMPIAALHDGTEFIVERYSVGLMPQLALTDTRYVNLENVEVLAMGASQFEEQVPLPSVPVELKSIAQQLWQGTLFLNEEFTLENLKRARASHPYGIIHLATHAEFAPGSAGDSYIQFWQSQLHLEQLRQLGWHKPPVELLVLSACRTALGDAETELGFAGFAVHAGVKSVLASLWYVSDEGTLALMREFYQQLSLPEVTTKAEALRRAQVAMIEGQLGVGAEQGRGIGWQDNTLAAQSDRDLSHPYYWSAFTLVGNPW